MPASATSPPMPSIVRGGSGGGGGAGGRGRRGGGGGARQLAYPAQPGRGLLVAVENLGELLDRAEEQIDVEQEGDQCAGRESSAADTFRADAAQQREGDLAQQFHAGEVDRDRFLGTEATVPVGARQLLEAFGVMGLLPERLRDVQAGHALLKGGAAPAESTAAVGG